MLVVESHGGMLVLPGSLGCADRQGARANPESGMLYVSCAVSPETVGRISDPDRSSMHYSPQDALVEGSLYLPVLQLPWGRISALDLQMGEFLWRRPKRKTPSEI